MLSRLQIREDVARVTGCRRIDDTAVESITPAEEDEGFRFNGYRYMALHKNTQEEDQSVEHGEQSEQASEESGREAEVEEFEVWPEWTVGPEMSHAKTGEFLSERHYGFADRTLKLKPDFTSSYSSSLLHHHRAAKCACKFEDLVISPISPQRMIWDILGVLFLMYDMIWIPMQAFTPPASLFADSIDFTVATYWTLDIIGTFFTAYYGLKGELEKLKAMPWKMPKGLGWHALERSFVSHGFFEL
eukprot:g12484.t1